MLAIILGASCRMGAPTAGFSPSHSHWFEAVSMGMPMKALPLTCWTKIYLDRKACVKGKHSETQEVLKQKHFELSVLFLLHAVRNIWMANVWVQCGMQNLHVKRKFPFFPKPVGRIFHLLCTSLDDTCWSQEALYNIYCHLFIHRLLSFKFRRKFHVDSWPWLQLNSRGAALEVLQWEPHGAVQGCRGWCLQMLSDLRARAEQHSLVIAGPVTQLHTAWAARYPTEQIVTPAIWMLVQSLPLYKLFSNIIPGRNIAAYKETR